jgi:hypothetical protein
MVNQITLAGFFVNKILWKFVIHFGFYKLSKKGLTSFWSLNSEKLV